MTFSRTGNVIFLHRMYHYLLIKVDCKKQPKQDARRNVTYITRKASK